LFDQIKLTADSVQEAAGGLILSGAQVNLELPGVPRCYLYSGWQSWSLTAWVETGRRVRRRTPGLPTKVRKSIAVSSGGGSQELTGLKEKMS